MVLLSLATTAHAASPHFQHLKNIASQYLSNPYAQYASKIGSNLCQTAMMCGSGLAWFGKTGLAGTYYTTELIKNNPKIAGTIALYTAWYMGQKRWAANTINEANEFLTSINDGVPNPTFKTWKTYQYPSITSIMNNKIKIAEELLHDYDTFSSNSFCDCLKNKGNADDKKAKAIKLALEMEYASAKQILNLFTEGRTFWLTYVPSWIKEWIQNNYNINGDINIIFDLYNILITGDTKEKNPNLQTKREELIAAERHIEIGRDKDMWEASLKNIKIELNNLIKTQATRYEQNLNQFITQKMASTGLPVTSFATEKPAAYWSWMQTARWKIPSGFIWPYEREASQLYWELFKYTQRIAALLSAIAEYIKQNRIPDADQAYNLNQFDQVIAAANRFLGNSPECNAQYCIRKLQAPK